LSRYYFFQWLIILWHWLPDGFTI